ncbi:ribonuclease M5 [Anoxybacillus gonensis]|nr:MULTISPECIES: ribonuclease M5 [Anoxybacillus]AKS37044.1 ribonuclease M5 [Anoxybacillus gonensis]AXM88854.1 ribonuclease M5 [Anoxybacillus ayderensis G10]KGP59451.1 ribonuclease M5 [Anoxybacillus gonensis]THD15220.1 ribonuclease M5 [Anoxybacillus ayderensis]
MEVFMKIKEIIVVEGRDDTVAIRRAVDADTIETNGAAINDETIERIRLAQQQRGVIIFTDPDYPGEKIRKTIAERVPGCKHAFLTREEARGKHGKGLGVEHASIEAIRTALLSVYEEMIDPQEEISFQQLVDAGLIGGPLARARREKLGKLLKIGYTNGKQLHKRLQMFQISKEQFVEAMKQVMQEEEHV